MRTSKKVMNEKFRSIEAKGMRKEAVLEYFVPSIIHLRRLGHTALSVVPQCSIFGKSFPRSMTHETRPRALDKQL